VSHTSIIHYVHDLAFFLDVSYIYIFFLILLVFPLFSFFFFTDPATTEIYTLSLHDALPIFTPARRGAPSSRFIQGRVSVFTYKGDRKSTRLNSSHLGISYAVFCLKKKKKKKKKKKEIKKKKNRTQKSRHNNKTIQTTDKRKTRNMIIRIP